MTPRRKWRPALWMVIFGAVLAVAFSPLASLYAIRAIENTFGVDFRFHTVWDAGAVLIITVLIGLVLAYVASRTLLGPIARLIERTAEIERGDARAFRSLDHYGTREFALLGERFGRLARRLSRRNEHLVLFSRHLSHELKSPLTAIRGAVELLRDEPDMDPVQRARFLGNVIADTERLAALATRLRELAQADLASGHGECDLRAAAGEVVAGIDGLSLEMAGEATLPMPAEAAGIVLRQLAANARENGAGVLRLRVDGAAVLVGDDGAPIPEGNRARLFEPFFTTRRDAGGTGLGLPIAAGMAASHGMALEAGEGDWKFRLE